MTPRSHSKQTLPFCILSMILFMSTMSLMAQPSGGPYGPSHQTYQIPKSAKTIYYTAPDADEKSSGQSIDTPCTLSEAIKKATTGDAIILKGGIYRTGNLKYNQGITLQPYGNEKPVLKGSLVADNWTLQSNGIWSTKWDKLFPESSPDWWRRHRQGTKSAPWHFNYDMVFKNGKSLNIVGWEGDLDENSFCVDYENGVIYIAFDPTDHLVEITAFDCALERVTTPLNGIESDGTGPKIRGITFTQYAYRALEIDGTEGESFTTPDTLGKEVTNTLLENVTIAFCSRTGAYLRGDGLIIRNCLVTDTGMEGLYIISSRGVLMEKNIITRTNVIRNLQGIYPAAVKIFNQCYDTIVKDNLIIDNPNSSGVWWDVGNVNATFINNWVETTDNGLFFEISHVATCAGNVFINCGTGIRIHNSRDVSVFHNTMINSTLEMWRDTRSAENDHFGWHPSAGPDVDERENHQIENNLFVADQHHEHSMVQSIQHADLKGVLTSPQPKTMDNNVYVSLDERSPSPIMWNPSDSESGNKAYDTWQDFLDLNTGFGTHSRFFDNYQGPLFRSISLYHLELQSTFPGIGTAMGHEQKYGSTLPWTKTSPGVPGAMPVMANQ